MAVTKTTLKAVSSESAKTDRTKALDGLLAKDLSQIAGHLRDLADGLFEHNGKHNDDPLISGSAFLMTAYAGEIDEIASGFLPKDEQQKGNGQ